MKVNGARFFAAQAVAVSPQKRDEFGHFIEAAIVFGRSATFHLQKEYAHAPDSMVGGP